MLDEMAEPENNVWTAHDALLAVFKHRELGM
jgi:hypothetical protein